MGAGGPRRAGGAGLSLEVRAGEIVAVAGVAGNGQRELAEAIAGLRRARARLDPGRRREAAARRSAASLGAGIAFIPEDRLATGVAPGLEHRLESRASLLPRPLALARPAARLGLIRERAVGLIARYRIAAPGPALPARQLSGGNLQKVVIAREFSGGPRVVIAASPTQGLDVGATETVRAYLREAAAGGAAVLLFSEDLDEILELSDRIDVIYEGAIAGEVPSGAGIEEIGLLMAGGGTTRPTAPAGPKTGA